MGKEIVTTTEEDGVQLNEQTLRDRIHIVRGQQVMLDFDLAEIYGYSTKRFNEQVKNNMERFDNDFRFQLTKEEMEGLRSKKSALKLEGDNRGAHRKYLPYAFTEQGIYMLMTVLKGDLAVRQSKALIRLFKSMKDYIVETGQAEELRRFGSLTHEGLLHSRLNRVEEDVKVMKTELDNKMNQEDFEKAMEQFRIRSKSEGYVLFQGQWFSADVLLNKIFSQARHTIGIVDPYVGIRTLNALVGCRKDVEISVWTHNIKELPQETFDDFIREHCLRVSIYRIGRNEDHDRFIFIDRDYPKLKKFYFIGSSLKDTGKSLTMIIQSPFVEKASEGFTVSQPIMRY
ncbi:MAG: ORF6N domain-containing protein [Erysipelotrichaceae bacterium]|nr:ORF6N domain-containing protein [Erysipelotrichaceae bacterium]